MRRPAGFTLIELLVALAVVAVALAAVQRTTLQAVSNTDAMQIASFAHWIARDHITGLRIRQEWPRPGEQRGTLQLAGRDWHWERRVNSTEDARLRRIEITVRLEADPRDSVRTRLESYLLQPQSVSPAAGGSRR
ncbi:MAG: type II secretion system minor pseudopilin GspI [Gammaproteobacteria bacterium]|nr:type II secretion system minor pseudopilin GspI [Gammaproteobacteria bacterium]MDX5375287.1 type II secretion system minor pseudopilin GspI [Gammaproteobacteria bacterium]